MRKSLAWTIYLSTFALFGLLFLATLLAIGAPWVLASAR